MYTLNFSFTDSDIARIYSNKAIQKAFKTMMRESNGLLECRVSSILKAIIKQSSYFFLQHDLGIQPSDIISDFYKNLKVDALYQAINLSITKDDKFDVKDNVIEVLNSRFIMDCILGDYFLGRVYRLMKSKADYNEEFLKKVNELDIFEKFTI